MLFKKKTTIKYSLTDRDRLRSLRLQAESVESNYVLGLIGPAEYITLLANISDQVEALEVKYGIIQAS